MSIENKGSYTILILSKPTATPYRFILTKRALQYAIGFTSFGVFLLMFFLFSYFSMSSKALELESLRKEARSQRFQITSFAATIEELRGQMVRLEEFERKLRVITDLGGSGFGERDAGLLGMGGSSESSVGLSVMEDRVRGEVVGRMGEELERLRVETSRQEASFQEIREFIEGRKSLWASTPSIWPVRGWVTSGFGNRVSPFTGSFSMHNGIDIAADPGTPVISPASGVVVFVGFDGGMGKVVKIDHGYGIKTLHGHLLRATVRVGQRIKRGQQIGMVGNTGLSTGPHLHYEILVNRIPVNPYHYILN